ncbi:MAG TPA: 50S ribosomal protein L6 [archaeon]|jgi:large subunit ribosomal protein L6|nr:50S ribosomal protein L6 [archaeon]
MPEKTVQIPDGVEVKLDGKELVVKGKNGELRRAFSHPAAKVEIKEGTVVFSSDSNRKRNRAIVGTWAAHFRNMCSGASRPWEARLKIIYSHFPIKVSVEGKKVVIGNFLGGRKNREAAIVGDTKVEVAKDEIIVTGIHKENVGHTAANIERAAKVQGFDRRIFQDGCHLVQKARRME